MHDACSDGRAFKANVPEHDTIASSGTGATQADYRLEKCCHEHVCLV